VHIAKMYFFTTRKGHQSLNNNFSSFPRPDYWQDFWRHLHQNSMSDQCNPLLFTRAIEVEKYPVWLSQVKLHEGFK
jgi:hypothetical protein